MDPYSARVADTEWHARVVEVGLGDRVVADPELELYHLAYGGFEVRGREG